MYRIIERRAKQEPEAHLVASYHVDTLQKCRHLVGHYVAVVVQAAYGARCGRVGVVADMVALGRACNRYCAVAALTHGHHYLDAMTRQVALHNGQLHPGKLPDKYLVKSNPLH